LVDEPIVFAHDRCDRNLHARRCVRWRSRGARYL